MKARRLLAGAAVGIAMFFVGREYGSGSGWWGGWRGGDMRDGTRVEVRTDTLVVRDTVRQTVFMPVERRVVRVDTVFLTTPGDTVRVAAQVPIERRVYATTDYRAVVEGFRPALVELELYRDAIHVTRRETVTRAPKRWGIGIQAGYGVTRAGLAPYVGVGVQYNLAAW